MAGHAQITSTVPPLDITGLIPDLSLYIAGIVALAVAGTLLVVALVYICLVSEGLCKCRGSGCCCLQSGFLRVRRSLTKFAPGRWWVSAVDEQYPRKNTHHYIDNTEVPKCGVKRRRSSTEEMARLNGKALHLQMDPESSSTSSEDVSEEHVLLLEQAPNHR